MCLSDTHGTSGNLGFEVPWGHVFLLAGDFTGSGQPQHVKEFNDFLKTLPHEHKVVIAGNHDLTFDSANWPAIRADVVDEIPELKDVESADVKALLTNCTYLENEEATVRGFRIYGSPW